MPAITLPDGSQKQFDQPVTVLNVAADIGPDEILLGAGGVADRPVVRRIPGDADLNTELNTFAWSLGAEDDGHASAAYRRQLVRELGYKLLTEAQP